MGIWVARKRCGPGGKPTKPTEDLDAYTRLELVDKDELFPENPLHPSFRIGAYTVGGVRDLVQNRVGQIGLGADLTFYSKPSALDPFYGDNPVSFKIFLRLRPGLAPHMH